MSAWLHHMLFDPISQWERFKFESACAVAVAFVVLIVYGIASLVCAWRDRERG